LKDKLDGYSNTRNMSQVFSSMPIILALVRLREDCELEASLSYIDPASKKKKRYVWQLEVWWRCGSSSRATASQVQSLSSNSSMPPPKFERYRIYYIFGGWG
jgi:hypothetical protein